MRWYRKAQLVWFGVFSVAFMTIAWAALPVTHLTTASGTTFVLDHVMYTVIALVLAGLLAVAAGAETDYQDALRRYGFTSAEAFDPNKAMMYWMRVGAILFILTPFVLLGLEVEGHIKPITYLRAGMPPDAGDVFMLLYNSVYGLCITLLAIDFFLTPMSAQIIKQEASFTSKDQLVAQTFELCTKFLGQMDAIVRPNASELRGTPNVWTTLNAVVQQAESLKKAASMLPIDVTIKNVAIGHIAALEDKMSSLIDFLKFLSNYDATSTTAGRRSFRRIVPRKLADELAHLSQRIETICADMGLVPQPSQKESIEDAINDLDAQWLRVRALALVHYGLTDS